MDIISIYSDKGKIGEFFISSWYCKPVFLECLAYRLKKDMCSSLLFVSCSKYGCRQFLPKFHKSFPVHNLNWLTYKTSSDWCLIEFNDYAC